MKHIRVLQFITPAGFYGAERWVLALANNCRPDTVSYDLAVTQEGPGQDLRVADYYPQKAGNVYRLKSRGRFDPRVIRRLVEVIRERDIDVILTHGYKSDILGYIASRIAGIKCVSTPHGFSGNVGWKLRFFIYLGTRFLRHFDAVAPLSEELVADMDRFRVNDRKVHFIRNGVDLTEIRPFVDEAAPQREGDSKTIGFVGQLIPRKGVNDLIRIFDQLYKWNSNLRLQIIGDGRQRAELETLARSLECAGAIEFLGFRDDRLKLMSGFDLFVMTSSLEGIPRCLMEAMALGVPVAAYDIPGVDQLVEHGKTGLLASLGDRESLAAHCQTILANRELAAGLTEVARHHIDTTYSAGRMAQEYEVLFAQLLGFSAPVGNVNLG